MKIRSIRVHLAGDPDEGIPDYEISADLEESEDLQACSAQLNVEVQEMRRAARQANEAREKLALAGLEEKAGQESRNYIFQNQPHIPQHAQDYIEAMRTIHQSHLRLIRLGRIADAENLLKHKAATQKDFEDQESKRNPRYEYNFGVGMGRTR